MSSGGAKDVFVLIPALWEQPGKGERRGGLGPGWAAGPPLGGSASWSAAGWGFMPGLWTPWPASQPTHPLHPDVSGFGQGTGWVTLWLSPWSKGCDGRELTWSRVSPAASLSSGSDSQLHLPGLKHIQLFPITTTSITTRITTRAVVITTASC